MWTLDQIESDWLVGGVIAVPRDEIVAAFNVVERMLGNDWINSHRVKPSGVFSGIGPTLSVVQTGRELSVVEGRRGAAHLVSRLRGSDRAAFFELKAMYLVCEGLNVELEIESPVSVGERTRTPDFRVREPGSAWTNVEVAAPDVSDAREEAEAIMGEIASILPSIPANTAVDLFLRRDPDKSDVEFLKNEMLRIAATGTAGDYDLGHAVISVNMSPPSLMEPRDFGAESYTPRLGLARLEGVGGQPANKRVSVRYPYSDQRAEEFLTSEAKQLPRDEPGLVMLGLSGTIAPFKSWRPLLTRRLQPNLHTRVSAIGLFHAGIESTSSGEGVLIHTSIIANPHARFVLPAWISASMQRREAA